MIHVLGIPETASTLTYEWIQYNSPVSQKVQHPEAILVLCFNRMHHLILHTQYLPIFYGFFVKKKIDKR